MDEYIRKEDAIRLAEQGQVQGFPWQFQMLVRLSPADITPVVRCRYCKHFMPPHACLHDDGMITARSDGFCSYGERKE